MFHPKRLSRREVLQTATVLGVGAVSAALAAEARAADSPIAPDSGLVTGRPKPLKYEEIPGLLTREQVAPHYQAHYGGALKRFVALEDELDKLLRSDEKLTGYAYGAMHKDQVSRMNSVLLHELYFDNLVPTPGEPRDDIRTALENRFGSLERWAEDFRGCAMAANGWAILARDAVNGRFYNVASDLHEVGVLWLGQPLIVCDVYEHAFYVDYQNRKQEYVDKFVEYLDWDEIDRRRLTLSA